MCISDYVEANLAGFLRACPDWTETEARSELRSIWRETCLDRGVEVEGASPPDGADLAEYLYWRSH